ncbi:hypothetical protein AB6846_01775 [Serratia proteamaculans]
MLTTQSVQRYLSTDGQRLDDGVAGFEALVGPLELAQLDKTALDAYSVLPAPFNVRDELKKIGYLPMPFLFWINPLGSTEYDPVVGEFRLRRKVLFREQTKLRLTLAIRN